MFFQSFQDIHTQYLSLKIISSKWFSQNRFVEILQFFHCEFIWQKIASHYLIINIFSEIQQAFFYHFFVVKSEIRDFIDIVTLANVIEGIWKSVSQGIIYQCIITNGNETLIDPVIGINLDIFVL